MLLDPIKVNGGAHLTTPFLTSPSRPRSTESRPVSSAQPVLQQGALEPPWSCLWVTAWLSCGCRR